MKAKEKIIPSRTTNNIKKYLHNCYSKLSKEDRLLFFNNVKSFVSDIKKERFGSEKTFVLTDAKNDCNRKIVENSNWSIKTFDSYDTDYPLYRTYKDVIEHFKNSNKPCQYPISKMGDFGLSKFDFWF